VELAQVAPGRYEGVIEGAEDRGTYFLTMEARVPGAGQSILTTGVSVPYPAEYRELESNPGLLDQIATITGGRTVELRDALRFDAADSPFRHDMQPPTASRDIWHLLIYWAVVLFLLDVAVRRIALDLVQVRPALATAWAYLRGRPVEVKAPEYMAKLRSRKAEVGRQLDQARSARRFEPAPDAAPATAAESLLESAGKRPAAANRPATSPDLAPEAAKIQESYTSRLLKAKQKVWQQNKPN
jgi:hypothetical protein